jgi:hypothetical protein
MHRLTLLAVTSTVLLTACADLGTDPLDRPAATNPPSAVTFNTCTSTPSATRVAQISVAALGAIPDDGVDDTCAFQRALDSAHVVVVPAGTWRIRRALRVSSNTRIVGDSTGSASRIQLVGSPGAAFAPRGNSNAFVDSVTVEWLTFRGARLNYGVSAQTVRHFTFRKNQAEHGISLVRVNTHLPINVWDGTADPAATAGLTSASQLSSNIKVLDNTATGAHNLVSLAGEAGAILIQYARDVLISGNTLDNFQHGIQWWGGDADPQRGGVLANPRWFRDALIEHNLVTNTEGGIWGGMGQDVLVRYNSVAYCLDVCLDAEGDVRTTFLANNARDAGVAVLAAFHYASQVTFAWNDVRITDPGYSGRLFHTNNAAQDPTGISVYVHNNQFRWLRPTGIGVAGREASEYLGFSNNTLENVRIEMISNNSGGLFLTGNGLSFTRSTGGEPAIKAGRNYGAWGSATPPVNGIWEMELAGNWIVSTVPQTASGIHALQDGGLHQIDTWIHSNNVQAFSPSISVSRTHTNQTFLIENNHHTGALPTPGTNLTVRNNTWIP